MLMRLPDHTSLYLDGRVLDFAGARTSSPEGQVRFELSDGKMTVFVSAPDTGVRTAGVRWVRLRWDQPMRTGVKVLGDAWERSYGELGWETVRAGRCMPWYMAVSNGSDLCRDFSGRLTECFGVAVRPAAMCMWQYDEAGVTLWMDIRNGGCGTLLGERELCCGTVLFADYPEMSAYDALRSFCALMSPAPYKADHVVYGSNNWYYAYGKSSAEEILADTRFVADLCRDNDNPPYMVIDDGWQPHPINTPWTQGNERFPDMAGLAAEMKKLGVRPGIWVRPIIDGENGVRYVDMPGECYLAYRPNTLDPSHPAVREYVAETIRRLTGWGYELIKHDYSTFDLFGRWGIQIKDKICDDGWHFYDRTRTSAEIVTDLYRTIREAAGGAVIIGCNVIGHLCAGLHQLNRTGDDTSGYDWQRTVTNGVNTVAFRLCQNGHFFGADGDCVGIMGRIDWSLNRRWLKFLSESGTPLFVSCKPDVADEQIKADLREAFRRASVARDEMIPLDWMECATPHTFLVGDDVNGERVTYDWYPEKGAETFRPGV